MKRFIHFSWLLVTLLLISTLLACDSNNEKESGAKGFTVTEKEQTAAAKPAESPTVRRTPTKNTEEKMKQYDATPSMTIDTSKNYLATFIMEKGGEFTIELYPKEAPMTVNNFVFLSRDGYYDGITFHRVIKDFMAQAGDPTGTGAGGPGYKFDNEVSPIRRHNTAGSVSMANAGVRDGKGTNGSQFFITFIPTPFLDGYNEDGTAKDCRTESCHTVFGRVTDGMDVVNAISIRDPQTASSPGDRIKTIKIIEK